MGGSFTWRYDSALFVSSLCSSLLLLSSLCSMFLPLERDPPYATLMSVLCPSISLRVALACGSLLPAGRGDKVRDGVDKGPTLTLFVSSLYPSFLWFLLLPPSSLHSLRRSVRIRRTGGKEEPNEERKEGEWGEWWLIISFFISFQSFILVLCSWVTIHLIFFYNDIFCKIHNINNNKNNKCKW